MGLFSALIGYQAGVKRGRRDAVGDYRGLRVPIELLERCDRCGHHRMRHDDDDRCPTYQ